LRFVFYNSSLLQPCFCTDIQFLFAVSRPSLVVRSTLPAGPSVWTVFLQGFRCGQCFFKDFIKGVSKNNCPLPVPPFLSFFFPSSLSPLFPIPHLSLSASLPLPIRHPSRFPPLPDFQSSRPLKSSYPVNRGGVCVAYSASSSLKSGGAIHRDVASTGSTVQISVITSSLLYEAGAEGQKNSQTETESEIAS